VESVLAVGLGPHELLTSDERHCVWLVGGNLGECTILPTGTALQFYFFVQANRQKNVM
jgi:hypothetical protein